MTRLEHLLTIGMEECNEVAQRLSKALRFGLDEVQAKAAHGVVTSDPDESLTNAERIRKEYSDLAAVLEMIGIGAPLGRWMDEKRAKVEMFLEYSRSVGTLQDDNEQSQVRDLAYRIVTGDGAQLENLDFDESYWRSESNVLKTDGDLEITISVEDWMALVRIAREVK